MGYIQNLNQLGKQVADYLSVAKTLHTSFYSACPNRLFYPKETYKNYIKSWTAKKTYEQIKAKVDHYPNWHWIFRLWHWGWNTQTYKQYHWVVYRECKKEIEKQKQVLRFFTLDNPPQLLHTTMKGDLMMRINYLPKQSMYLLTRLGNIFNTIRTLWNDKIITEKDEDPSTEEKLPPAENKENFMQNRNQLAYLKICGFLNFPNGTPLPILRERLHRLCAYEDESRIMYGTVEVEKQSQSLPEKFVVYGRVLSQLEMRVRNDSKALVFNKEPLSVEEQKAYELGLNEAKASWKPFVDNNDSCFLLYVQLSITLFGDSVIKKEAEAKQNSMAQTAFSVDLQSLPSLQELNLAYQRLAEQAHAVEESKSAVNADRIPSVVGELGEKLNSLQRVIGNKLRLPRKPSFMITENDLQSTSQKGKETNEFICSLFKDFNAPSPDFQLLKHQRLIRYEQQVFRQGIRRGNSRINAYLMACGLLNQTPGAMTPKAMWNEVKQKYLKHFHADTMPKTYVNEEGEVKDIPPHILTETANELFNYNFSETQEMFGVLKSMDEDEIKPENFPINQKEFIDLGEQLAVANDELIQICRDRPRLRAEYEDVHKKSVEIEQELAAIRSELAATKEEIRLYKLQHPEAAPASSTVPQDHAPAGPGDIKDSPQHRPTQGQEQAASEPRINTPSSPRRLFQDVFTQPGGAAAVSQAQRRESNTMT